MEYDLTRLETGSYEHACCALFERQLGPGAGQFGAGPGGGREATFTGRLEWKSGRDTVSWDGYTP